MAARSTTIRRWLLGKDYYWRYVANFKPWLSYQVGGRKDLTGVQQLLLNDLRRDGVGITTVDELFGSTALFEELDVMVQSLEKRLANKIAKAREKKDSPGFKTYLTELLGPRPVLDPSDICVRLALEPAVLNIATAYLGMYARLRFFNVWHNFSSDSPARDSQLWHRDPEDENMFRMFVYLSDVDEGAGPLVYAPGTHKRGKTKGEPETFGEEYSTARRADDEHMDCVVPEKRWITATGRKGTVVLADTWGWHKGGLSRRQDRIAYNCMFTSQATTRGEYFERKCAMPRYLEREVAFALGA